jgi:hypothetical protein
VAQIPGGGTKHDELAEIVRLLAAHCRDDSVIGTTVAITRAFRKSRRP